MIEPESLTILAGLFILFILWMIRDVLGWWLWRRWRIYCPKYPVHHLFERPDFQNSLFDYEEAFVSPCTFNEVNCGGIRGTYTPKIRIIGLQPDERMMNE